MTERAVPDASILSGWRKSSYSGPEAGSCVEITDHCPSGIAVRDSKEPHGPALAFHSHDWSAFISAVKAGEFSA
ncbi:DUF397 domain-containing protein [Streptomyces sp. NPDC002055]|uniref:DUF397 domain-containing protein n=1 Tax=Streptomyces sp. NPDC002055 TaxID=3154534 RepID=UPI00332E4918